MLNVFSVGENLCIENRILSEKHILYTYRKCKKQTKTKTWHSTSHSPRFFFTVQKERFCAEQTVSFV